MASVSKFFGLNNVSDPLRLGLSWLVQADNVDVTDTGALAKRQGYSRTATGTFSDAFSTADFERMYVVDDGELKAMTSGASSFALATLSSTSPMHWTEINDCVFYNNGADAGIIQPDHTLLEWRWTAPPAPTLAAVTGNLPAGLYQVRCTMRLSDGRMSGAGESAEIELDGTQALQISGITPGADVYIAPANSTVYQLARTNCLSAMLWNISPDWLGVDLTSAFLDCLPLGCDVIAAYQGRIYAAQYMASDDQTVVWFSEPLAFHLFDLSANFIMVPGRVLMLAAVPTALIIGTQARIYAYNADGLVQLAPYGTVPGQHWVQDADNIIFWTVRGVCSALPFVNLTESQVSLAPGASAGGCIVHDQGRKRYLVAIRQGAAAAFNPR